MVDNDRVSKDLLSGPLGGFSARIHMAYMLGLIGKLDQRELFLIKRIRDRFAHDPRRSFDDDVIADRCSQLKIPDMFPGDMTDPRSRFHASVAPLANSLGGRALKEDHIEVQKDLKVTFHKSQEDREAET